MKLEGVIFKIGVATLQKSGWAIGLALEVEDVTRMRALEGELVGVIASVSQGVFDKQVLSLDDMGFSSTAAHGFNARMEGAFEGHFSRASDQVNQSVEHPQSVIRDVRPEIKSLRAEAEPISSGARALAGRTDSQAAAIEQTSAAMTEPTGTLKLSATHAGSAVSLGADAVSQAERGSEIVHEAMALIEASSGGLQGIVNMIDEIAFQTNPRALNAAVEAARAGDAGKGFAVVASEMRQRAQSSSTAANAIRALIGKSFGQVADGVRLAKGTGETLVTRVTSACAVAQRAAAHCAGRPPNENARPAGGRARGACFFAHSAQSSRRAPL
ncbi:MAG: methyl-accepting chemotaxis protein [Paracoccaceae bacterium]|jgi:methyl-accepting chemotaxis protein